MISPMWLTNANELKLPLLLKTKISANQSFKSLKLRIHSCASLACRNSMLKLTISKLLQSKTKNNFNALLTN